MEIQQPLGQDFIGMGLMNIIQAYQEEEEDEILDAVNPNEENEFLFEDVNMLNPNKAHLQTGMVNTYFFPVKDHHSLCQTFLEEGIQLWKKYFAPHIDSASSSKNQGFQIPLSWFNFITLMLVTPKIFYWIDHFLNSSLWDIIKEQIQNELTITFVIPDKCIV
jgi:hypothetical protein